ncbi:MAG TPA: Zn-ribbon domain-containing OB-fold protein [Chloroflexota bacterium]|nr:Zn-ribbon domain-containing OB-fold protein [Chloroflexota bacterium]
MTPDIAKPAPIADEDTQPFWDACKAHELRVQQCSACGRFRWPPRGFCPACFSWEHTWARLSGRGTVHSFSVVHHVVNPAFKAEAPYVVALISLEGTEGHVKLASNVVGCPWEEVRVGMEVEVVFQELNEDITLPKFRPVAG